jgi:hypothetical protein
VKTVRVFKAFLERTFICDTFAGLLSTFQNRRGCRSATESGFSLTLKRNCRFLRLGAAYSRHGVDRARYQHCVRLCGAWMALLADGCCRSAWLRDVRARPPQTERIELESRLTVDSPRRRRCCDSGGCALCASALKKAWCRGAENN